jgi:hypothetical protein
MTDQKGLGDLQNTAKFREHYNHERPHSALADQAPAAFAELHRRVTEKTSTSLGRMKPGERTVDAEKLWFRLVQKNGSGQSTENLHRDWNSEREHIAPFFHSVSVIAAILRASVRRTMVGLMPFRR